MHLPEQQVATLKDAARKLTGAKRRAFQAQVTLDYLEGRARLAETVLGWYRKTVELGLHELRTGIVCVARFSDRGNRRSEEKQPRLAHDICALADPVSQVDPKFQSSFLYTRITAKAMREALIEEKGWTDEDLPCVNTIGNILNRLGYRLRRVQKAKPQKRVAETDAIFENVHTSGGESRRLIKGGGGRLNGRVIENELAPATLADVTAEGTIKLSAGKKRHALVRPV